MPIIHVLYCQFHSQCNERTSESCVGDIVVVDNCTLEMELRNEEYHVRLEDQAKAEAVRRGFEQAFYVYASPSSFGKE